MSPEELTPLQRAERGAMLREPEAITVLVSAIREFRAASAKLLDSRYRDGGCDAVALFMFGDAIKEIEGAHGFDQGAE